MKKISDELIDAVLDQTESGFVIVLQYNSLNTQCMMNIRASSGFEKALGMVFMDDIRRHLEFGKLLPESTASQK